MEDRPKFHVVLWTGGVEDDLGEMNENALLGHMSARLECDFLSAEEILHKLEQNGVFRTRYREALGNEVTMEIRCVAQSAVSE